ncbi:DUF1707 domain-containing protein [Luteococcus sp. H138]|uniref:DUF1707 SHOCT-like domain-containing protein n=1 Tax=unclassified Luteococcus TaxID=2639923 RepID=UPI00313C2EC9
MSQPASPNLPEPRIGDAEREDAAELLRDHLTAGRIDPAEFDERIGQALQARTLSQLDALFRDLPGRRPGHERAPAVYAPTGNPGEKAPVAWEDQGEPTAETPWWAHWGLFVATIVLVGASRGRLGPLVPVMALWCFWLGPALANSLHERQLDEHYRRHGVQRPNPREIGKD